MNHPKTNTPISNWGPQDTSDLQAPGMWPAIFDVSEKSATYFLGEAAAHSKTEHIRSLLAHLQAQIKEIDSLGNKEEAAGQVQNLVTWLLDNSDKSSTPAGKLLKKKGSIKGNVRNCRLLCYFFLQPAAQPLEDDKIDPFNEKWVTPGIFDGVDESMRTLFRQTHQTLLDIDELSKKYGAPAAKVSKEFFNEAIRAIRDEASLAYLMDTSPHVHEELSENEFSNPFLKSVFDFNGYALDVMHAKAASLAAPALDMVYQWAYAGLVFKSKTKNNTAHTSPDLLCDRLVLESKAGLFFHPRSVFMTAQELGARLKPHQADQLNIWLLNELMIRTCAIKQEEVLPYRHACTQFIGALKDEQAERMLDRMHIRHSANTGPGFASSSDELNTRANFGKIFESCLENARRIGLVSFFEKFDLQRSLLGLKNLDFSVGAAQDPGIWLAKRLKKMAEDCGDFASANYAGSIPMFAHDMGYGGMRVGDFSQMLNHLIRSGMSANDLDVAGPAKFKYEMALAFMLEMVRAGANPERKDDRGWTAASHLPPDLRQQWKTMLSSDRAKEAALEAMRDLGAQNHRP